MSLETLASPLEFQFLKLCECEQCLAAQHEFVKVDPGRPVEVKRSTTRNHIPTVFLEGSGAGERSATVTREE